MTILYLLFACSLVFTFATLVRFSLVSALIACLLLSPFFGSLSNIGSGVTVPRLFIIPFVLVFFFGLVKAVNGKDVGFSPLFILVWFAFVSLTVVKAAILARLEGADLATGFLKYGYFITGAGIIMFNNKIDISSFHLPIRLGGFFLAIVGILQLFYPQWATNIGISPPMHFDRILPLGLKVSARITALHGNPNAAAIYYGVSALTFEWFGLQQSGRSKFFALLGLLLCTGCLILTFSRAGCFSFALCSLLLILLFPAEQPRGWLIQILWLFLLSVMIATLLSTRKFGSTSDITRIGLWIASLKSLRSESIQVLLGYMGTKPINTHSGPLQILYDYGLLGFLLYAILLAMALYHTLKRLKLGSPYLLILAIILYFTLIDVGHSSAVSSVIFWIFLAGTQLTFEK